eukprot:TRINITY_DN26557_c0_g1_i1.p2 TRINITY_DN26557_c0_g1~~TRINITY_DN26557_c0_g1_i1.p2  ORF type:complete len:131 (+),score=54.10 TRINITY_DN26557_c0_g1_i1:63-455(+)
MWFSLVLQFFFFSSRRRHTRCREVSWARRCVQETGINAEYMGNIIMATSAEKKPIETKNRGSVDLLDNEEDEKQSKSNDKKTDWKDKVELRKKRFLCDVSHEVTTKNMKELAEKEEAKKKSEDCQVWNSE